MIGPRHREAIAAGVRLSAPFTARAHIATPWTSISMEERRYVGH